MATRDTQAAPAKQSARCNECRHCVEVRGMQEVVCLAYLTIRKPTLDVACTEFQARKKKPPG